VIVEAANTFVLIIDTAIAWVQILTGAAAFVLCVACFAIGPLVTPAATAARARLRRPVWARGRFRARLYVARRVRAPRRRTAARPPWVHTQPIDYEEAA
jgi:hypothetical protein